LLFFEELIIKILGFEGKDSRLQESHLGKSEQNRSAEAAESVFQASGEIDRGGFCKIFSRASDFAYAEICIQYL